MPLVKVLPLSIGGQALPLNCNPTSSKPGSGRAPQREKTKQSTGRKQHSYSGKRRKELIEVLKEQNKEDYRPTPGSKFVLRLGR